MLVTLLQYVRLVSLDFYRCIENIVEPNIIKSAEFCSIQFTVTFAETWNGDSVKSGKIVKIVKSTIVKSGFHCL